MGPALRTDLVPLLIQNVDSMIFPAAIAVFAVARAALQQRAFEAERRVELVGQYARKSARTNAFDRSSRMAYVGWAAASGPAPDR